MIRKSVHTLTILTALFMLFSISGFSQYNSEEELKEAANKMFEDEKYNEALPLFGQLLSLYPKDLDYNFKYGTCVLIGSKEKEDALKYLKFATSKSTVNPLAFYFLAKAYHHNYEFSPAKVNYNKFKTKASPKDLQRFDVDREVKMCENGENLIRSMTDIGVLSRKDIKETDFFRSYDLKGIGGKIIVKPDEFKTKLDIKRNESSIIHLGEKKDMVIFSSYGKNGEKGKDLYKVTKLPNGEWSEPSLFAEELSTEFDEDYPFLHPDGQTLYFSSKGYNSMGGYDIFKSTLDLRTGKWSFPENIDFPINTPDDDILYISDIDNRLAYFASSRASKQGELTVYRVAVQPAPVENSVIKGFFLAEANPAMKDATITIKDVEKDRRYGVYKTHNVSGEYLLVFPSNGGKFKILVETSSSSPIHSATIELPVLESFRALKQELRLVGEGSDEKLVVKNLFDETDEFDFNDPLVVENIVKKKAMLDVNTTEEELLAKASNNSASSNENSNTSNYAQLSNEQLVNQADNTAEKLISQTEESKKQANAAYKKAEENSLMAKQLFAESEQLNQEANTVTSNEEKKKKMDLAESKKMEAANYVNKTIAALAVAQTLENEVVERNSDASQIKNIQEKINSNIDSGNRIEAEKNLAELDKIASATYHETSALTTESELNDKKLEDTKTSYNKARNRATELRNRENEIEADIEKLEKQKGSTKKKSEIEELQARIDVLKIDIDDNEFELDKAIVAEAKTKKAYDIQKNKNTTSSKIIEDVSNNATSASLIDENKKLQLENDIVYFEKEGLVDLYPETNEASNANAIENYNLADHKNEYQIIDDDGKIKDYNTSRSVELSEVDAINNPQERTKKIIKINESWIRDINEEIAIRNEQLVVELNPSKKTDLENRIASLQVLKEEKQREIDNNSQMLASNSTSNNSSNASTNSNNSNSNTNSSTVSSNKTSSTSNEKVNIINEDGSVKDYATIYTEQLSNTNDDNTYEAYVAKSNIHQNWVDATKEELLIRKMELAEAEESEKVEIENKIAILENNLAEQEEYVAIYNIQAESVAPSNVVVENTNNTSLNETNNSVNTNNENASINTTSSNENNEIENNTSENELAENSNSSNNSFNNNTNPITSNANTNVNITSNENNNESSSTTSVNEASTNNSAISSTNSSEAKIPEYELTPNKLNATEDEFSNLKYYDGFEYQAEASKSSVANVSELKTEAKNLKDESDVKLNEAATTSNAIKKAELISESEALTQQSEEKQVEIARAYETANRKEYQNNQAVIAELKKSNKDEYSNQALLIEMYEEEANNYYGEAQSERERAINAENFTVKESALQKAYELEMKAITKQNLAINQISGESLNEALANVENNTNTNTSNTARTNNENNITNNNSSVNDTENNSSENVLIENNTSNANTSSNNEVVENSSSNNASNTSTVNENTSNNSLSNGSNAKLVSSSTEISESDIATVQKMTPAEVVEVKNSENYQNYAELKKENRRLVKEAEVEYAEAAIYEQDAQDQKQLGTALEAMAAGSTDEADKAKKLSQIEKLKTMIAENEAKSSELKTSAAEKEKQAEQTQQQTDAILIAADEKEAANITAIEKLETYDSELLAEVINSNSSNSELAENANSNNEINNNARTNNESSNSNLSSNETNETETNTSENVVAENTNNANSNSNNEATENTNNTNINLNNELAENNTTNENFSANNNNATNETENSTNSSNETESNTANNTNLITNNSSKQPALSNIDNVPDKLDNSIFVMSNNQPVYNESKPIPKAKKLPEGLVFKVQIGAFRNPIPQNHFKGFAPIMAEDAGNGITRYTAGLFNSFNMANEAKNAIRSIGYSDAFVVAFYNGKRIGVAEARAMIGDNTVVENTFNVNTNSSSNNSNTNSTNNKANNNNSSSNTVATEEVKDGVSTDVRNIQGVFYAVQVGVYSKQVTAGQLNNVSPLNSERLANGLIRYTSGNFKNLSNANAAKDRIRNQGISDAFVVAYSAGNRVAVAEASKLLEGGSTNESTNTNNVTTSTTLDNTTNNIDNNASNTETNNESVNSENTTATEVETNTTTENNNTENTENKSRSGEPLNIEFKVKLGEYEEEVPVEDAARFLKLTSRGVKNYEENGKTIYVLGSFSEYQTALDTQIEMKEMGIENPKTVAYKDGKEIAVEEALELIKNNQ